MAYKTITVKGEPIHLERNSAAAITPGFLCEFTSSDTLQAHSTAGGTAAAMFALENENEGGEIGDDYAVGVVTLAGVFSPGDEVYALLADGEAVVIGSYVESYGDGYLRLVDADASAGDVGVKSVVGVALEALDMSDSSGADPASQRFRMMVV